MTRSTGIEAGATGRAADVARRVSCARAGCFAVLVVREVDDVGPDFEIEGIGRLLLATHQ
ncbi:hypothetical protein [Aliihoeflea sp. PC F10.4]